VNRTISVIITGTEYGGGAMLILKIQMFYRNSLNMLLTMSSNKAKP